MNTAAERMRRRLMSAESPARPKQVELVLRDGRMSVTCWYRSGTDMNKCVTFIEECFTEYLKSQKWWKTPWLVTTYNIYANDVRVTEL